ncbi:hypothetical protein P7C70_g6764, partial [Phenoliferia sp. Uapishka_3]
MAPTASTLATADLLPSDDEDEDFVAGSESDDSSDSEAERPAKKAKVEITPVEPVLTKAAVDDLWASFNAPEDQGTSASAEVAKVSPKKIKITVQYDFVGETIMQEKEVLEDSEEAKVWLAKQKSLPPASIAKSLPDLKGKGPSTSAEDALFGGAEEPTDHTNITPTPPIAPLEPLKPKPGPKRAKSGGLSSLAASLGKPAKLNTLEKSKLDWKKFVDKEDLSDDLTKARKDGYLEKQDFLQRTEARREEDYDKSKGRRR